MNTLELIVKLACVSYFPDSRFSLLVLHNRSNSFDSRCNIIFCLQSVLGLSLRLCIVSGLVTLGVVTILVFGIPVGGVVYISRLT